MAKRKLICPECGREFNQTHHKQKSCSEKCKRERKIRLMREWRKGNRARESQPKKKKLSALAIDNQAARAAGMTYGKYKALEYVKTVRIRRKG